MTQDISLFLSCCIYTVFSAKEKGFTGAYLTSFIPKQLGDYLTASFPDGWMNSVYIRNLENLTALQKQM